MKSGRIRRWAGKAQGCMRPIVRFRSGLRPSLHHTMEVKTQNQISHDSWYKERGHSTSSRDEKNRCLRFPLTEWVTRHRALPWFVVLLIRIR